MNRDDEKKGKTLVVIKATFNKRDKNIKKEYYNLSQTGNQ